MSWANKLHDPEDCIESLLNIAATTGMETPSAIKEER
jgi:hypothetical protein